MSRQARITWYIIWPKLRCMLHDHNRVRNPIVALETPVTSGKGHEVDTQVGHVAYHMIAQRWVMHTLTPVSNACISISSKSYNGQTCIFTLWRHHIILDDLSTPMVSTNLHWESSMTNLVSCDFEWVEPIWIDFEAKRFFSHWLIMVLDHENDLTLGHRFKKSEISWQIVGYCIVTLPVMCWK